MDERFQKRLLQYILRILPIPGDAVDARQKLVGVTVLEFDESRSVAGLRRRNQQLIAQVTQAALE